MSIGVVEDEELEAIDVVENTEVEAITSEEVSSEPKDDTTDE